MRLVFAVYSQPAGGGALHPPGVRTLALHGDVRPVCDGLIGGPQN